MTIFSTAYDTTFGAIISTENIKKALIPQLFSTQDYRQRTIKRYNSLNLYYISPFTNLEIFDIPAFNNPLLLEHEGKKVLVTDIRSYVNEKNTIKEDKIVTSNPTELTFAMFRTTLNGMWCDGKEKDIKLNLKFANIVYAAWISDTISKRFGLNYTEQLDVFIIAYYFYDSLFSNEPVSADNQILLVTNIVKASRSTATYVMRVTDQLTYMKDIHELIDSIKTIVPNRRLVDLNIGTLTTIVSSTWYGTHSKEILAVSLEHVPTFAAIVAVSVTQRFWKKSMITQIADRYGKGGLLDNYIENVNRILRDEPNI